MVIKPLIYLELLPLYKSKAFYLESEEIQMKEIKDILTSNDDFIDNIYYRFLWSNNVLKDKSKILSEIEQILDSIAIITEECKIQWLLEHRSGSIKSPDWSIVFCKDEIEGNKNEIYD